MAGAAQKKYPSRFSFQQRESLWLQAGGSKELAPLMAWISMHEDPSGDPAELNNNPATGDYSVGLWQINYYGNLLGPRTARYGSPTALAADPLAQARAAVDLAAGGNGLHNWTTYPAALKDFQIYGPNGPKIGTVPGVKNTIVDSNGNTTVQNPPGFTGIAGFIDTFNAGKYGKFILFGLAVLGGGMLILAGIILVAADLGLSARARALNPVVTGGRKTVNQFGNPSTDAAERRREELHQERLKREKIKTQAAEDAGQYKTFKAKTKQKNSEYVNNPAGSKPVYNELPAGY